MIPRDPFDSMPSSPRNSPQNLGNALLQIVRGRRGRTLIVSAVFAVVLLGLLLQSSSEVCFGISSEGAEERRQLSCCKDCED